MLVKTENSTYEIEGKKIRRLYGNRDATERQGKDGDWREFESLAGPNIGECMIIIWETIHPEGGNGEVIARSTLTSPIKEIVEEMEMN